jgi:hypothetical protein
VNGKECNTEGVPADRYFGGRARRLFPHAFLWGAVLLCYGPVLWGAESIWDDEAFLGNPLLSSWNGFLSIWWQPQLNPFEEHYWPVTYTVAFLLRQVFGASAGTFHVANVVLHASNASLLYELLRPRARWLALWGALAFACHPIQAESVAWIIEMKNVLSFFFAAISVLTFLRLERASRSLLSVGLGTGLFLFGLLSKSAVAPLPVLLLLLFWAEDRWSRTRVGFLVASALVAVAYSLLDLAVVSAKGKAVLATPLVERVGIAGLALLHYLRTMIWPQGLCAIYRKWEITPLSTAVGICGWVVLAGSLVWLLHRGRCSPRHRWLFLWLAGTVALLSPTLGLISFSYQRQSFVADRFAYHASAVLLPGLVALGWDTMRRLHVDAKMRGALAGMVVIVLALLTFQRAMIFRRVESLARDTLKKNERAWTARYYLANAMARRGDFEGALGQYSAVFWGTLEDFSQEELQKLEASTSHQQMSEPRMSFNRGLLAARKNQLEQALRAFDEATSNPQLRAQATIAIAAIEARRGNLESARQIITCLYEVPTTR